MNTIVIEILRKGQEESYILKSDLDYIALCGPSPAKDFKIDCSQEAFDTHVKFLRYDNNDETSRQLGIDFFQKLIAKVIDQIYPIEIGKELNNDILHLRLVTTPKEIAQLPFEMAITPLPLQTEPPQIPFFINTSIRTTFTREVRQVSFNYYTWPAKPRILFAWAGPNASVPNQGHFDAFMEVLKPWSIPLEKSEEPVPDLAVMITELRNATLATINDAITKAFNADKPYTHVHILAHGIKATDPNKEQFLLVLNSDNKDQRAFHADGNDLAKALIVKKEDKKNAPQVVSLIACDSGNMGSPVNPVGSIAHSLHQEGIPCVFASQFPLTQEGSVKLVETLYTQLLKSSDPRLSLYNVRTALAMDINKNHDWASLIAYARFPQDIEEQVKDVRLKNMLQFMKTSNALADHVFKFTNVIPKEKIETLFSEVNNRLNSSIENLTALLETTTTNKINKERHAEHYGLIGSAYKRKSEHLFRVDAFHKTEGFEESKQALQKAQEFYLKGYKYLNSHWNGTQYLSLSLVLENKPISEDEKNIWMLCKIMAQNDKKNFDGNYENLAWACGTLAEIFLFEPIVMQLNEQETKRAFAEAAGNLEILNKIENQDFPKESTARQLERYINWWPKMIKTKTMDKLQAMAIELRKELP